MKLIIMIALLFTLSTDSFAGSISGTIKDSETNEVLSGSIIRIKNTSIGIKSDNKGNFLLDNLANGIYTIRITYIGYIASEHTLTITDKQPNQSMVVYLLPKSLNASEIVVSAGKRSQSIQEVPVSISLLDQQQISQRNTTRIDEVLRYVPGVNVSRDQVSIRGSSGFALGVGSRVALLLDGFPMLSADNGDMKFDALPMMEINRVEVIKGAGSALYGTGALGGTVSLFTRTPSDSARTIIRTYGGIYTQPIYEQWRVYDSPPALYGIDIGYSKKFDNLELTMNVGNKYDKSYRLSDNSYRWSGYGKVGYQFDKRGMSKLTFFINAASEERGDWVFWNSLDSATRPPTGTNPNRRTESGKIASALEFKQFFSDQSFLMIRSGVFITNYKNTNLLPGEEQIASDALSWNSEIQYSASISSGVFLTSGINTVMNSVQAPIYGAKTQIFMSGYSQAEIKPGIENLICTAGARIDAEKTADAEQNIEISPKLALSYLSPFGIQFRASAGRGFRAAAVAERFAALRFQGITVEPNMNVKPEYSWSYECGATTAIPLSGEQDILLLDISYFQNELSDLIEPSFTPSGNIKFQNVTKARVTGLELGLRSMLTGGYSFETSLTLMKPEDLILKQTLYYRSSVLWYTRMSIPIIEDLLLQTDYRFISRTEMMDPRLAALGFIKDADARVPNHICDMRLIARLHNWVQIPISVTLNAKNIFDYYYTEIMGNLAPIRQLSIQAEYIF